MDATFKCVDCKQTKPTQTANGKACGIGYGEYAGNKVCYECCAERDRQHMRTSNEITLYWNDKEVTNWPGTLRIAPYKVTSGFYTWCGRPLKNTNVWFEFEGIAWRGTNKGDDQILRCKKLKRQPKAISAPILPFEKQSPGAEIKNEK
jgi:hypothetical protein